MLCVAGWRIQVLHPDPDVGLDLPRGRLAGDLAGRLLQPTLAPVRQRFHQTGDLGNYRMKRLKSCRDWFIKKIVVSEAIICKVIRVAKCTS